MAFVASSFVALRRGARAAVEAAASGRGSRAAVDAVASRRRQLRTAPVAHAGGRAPTMSEAERAAAARGEPTMVRARHILVESEELVDALAAQVTEGSSFADLAASVSTCPSKDKGGDLGWFKRRQMVPEFEAAAFGNAPGSVTKVHTKFGWHLLRVEAHGVASGNVNVQELAERWPDGRFQDDQVQFVDCRERRELELASLDGFLNLPMGEYDTWAENLESGQLGLDPSKETVVMCHHGVRSANFCSFLAQQGFSKVRNLLGGIDAYSKEIDSNVPTY